LPLLFRYLCGENEENHAIGRRDVKVSVVEGFELSDSRSDHFNLGNRSLDTHSTGGQVGASTDLDMVLKRIPAPAGNRTPVLQFVVNHFTDWFIAGK